MTELAKYLKKVKAKIIVAGGQYYVYNRRGRFCHKFDTEKELIDYLEWSMRTAYK